MVARVVPIIPRSLVELAERKIGKGVTVQVRGGEWRASRIVKETVKNGERTAVHTVTARSRDNLFRFLERLQDAPKTD